MAKTNTLDLTKNDYKGRPSTLCPGCGHNAISNQIISTAYDMAIEPHRVIKLSGIGCSSKSPAYFLGRSHGFNALHGRMPSVGTGAMAVNRSLIAIGVSGDGDTGSIGMGQFKHVMRRNVPMVYIIENNGVYGLTKGQHSATQDEGVPQKYYGINEYPAVDIALEAIVGGASFVARSFSGSPREVQALLSAAIRHNGLAVLDIISPCVAFNDTDASTKSYSYVRENLDVLHEVEFVGYVPQAENIEIDERTYERQGEILVEMHDGSRVVLKRVDEDSYDPTNRHEAIRQVEEARRSNKILTGLLYFEPERRTLHDVENLIDTPLVDLGEDVLRPSKEALDEIMQEMMI
ncbi:MAG: 2-oxoacid:ferredoxin oxidoreductase subunit beta [Chloroflexi bacterium]|nr:2-oxoacid:ferredoxin oxidoreductase subunit beta [Chloroflexota bacterium]